MPNSVIAQYPCGKALTCSIQRIDSDLSLTSERFGVYMLLTGTLQVTMDGELFIARADDVFSVEANTPCKGFGSDCTVVSVAFDQHFFERTLPVPRHPDFLCNSALLGDDASYDSLRRLIARIVKNNADGQLGYELRNWSLIYSLMDAMYQNFKVEDSEARHRNAHRYTERMAEISAIIHENFQTNLTLSELAGRVHLSAPYLSKFIEKQFGMTFLNYLQKVRLNHATNELLKTSNTIETISQNAGFPNSYAFVQAFKKEYGVLPSLYRKQAEEKPKTDAAIRPIEQHDYMSGLKKYLEKQRDDEPLQTVSVRASVRANNAIGSLRHTWRDLIGVTRASAILSAEIQEMLSRIRREIGFSYVKFNGIFSDDMHVYTEDASGKPVYSFVYTDKVLDFLQSISLKPMIQLGFMPEAMAKSKKQIFGYSVGEPASLDRWQGLTEAFLRHLIKRYGVEEVRTWRFSLWHQPDTPENMYGFSDVNTFYRFWKATYDAVKRFDPSLLLASPPTFYILEEDYENWYIPFIQWCRKNDCMPDALCFHYYDTAFTEELGDSASFGFARPMALREAANGFGQFTLRIQNERHQLQCDTLPIYLTEWNNTPSQQDLLNDTCFKSCYIIKGILENYDRLMSFGYWSLTDWMGEAPQPEQLFFGGLGLFTVNGIPKASYYAFSLLRELGDTLLGKGDGWFITKQDDTYAILLYHYRHFSNLYARGERFDMTFTDRYTPFSPENQLDAHISIRDIPNGEYTVTETIVSRHSGSSFDTWLSMGAPDRLTANEQKTLAARSVPAISKYRSSIQNGVLELDALLDMLEIRLLRIEKEVI